jgi:hypothetical protein
VTDGERSAKPVRRRGVERSLQIQVGRLGGIDVRPTRLFLWGGEEREGRERIVSLGTPPRSLLIPRREREVEAGAVHVRSLGNPLMTIALAGVHVARRLAREREEISERGSADPESGRSLRSPD